MVISDNTCHCTLTQAGDSVLIRRHMAGGAGPRGGRGGGSGGGSSSDQSWSTDGDDSAGGGGGSGESGGAAAARIGATVQQVAKKFILVAMDKSDSDNMQVGGVGGSDLGLPLSCTHMHPLKRPNPFRSGSVSQAHATAGPSALSSTTG